LTGADRSENVGAVLTGEDARTNPTRKTAAVTVQLLHFIDFSCSFDDIPDDLTVTGIRRISPPGARRHDNRAKRSSGQGH
jgi:hypothetical protein